MVDLAALAIFASIIFCINAWCNLSPSVVWLGRIYCLPSDIVTAECKAQRWTGCRYETLCEVNGQELYLPFCVSGDKRKMSLIAIKLSDSATALVQPSAFAKLMGVPCRVTKDAARLSKKAMAARVVALCMLVIACATISNMPPLSILLSCGAVAIHYFCRPAWRWEKCGRCGIVHAAKRVNAPVSDSQGLPPGYEYWTDDRKALYDIDKRTAATQADSCQASAPTNFDIVLPDVADSAKDADALPQPQGPSDTVPPAVHNSVNKDNVVADNAANRQKESGNSAQAHGYRGAKAKKRRKPPRTDVSQITDALEHKS